jgi:hypothetical protein
MSYNMNMLVCMLFIYQGLIKDLLLLIGMLGSRLHLVQLEV